MSFSPSFLTPPHRPPVNVAAKFLSLCLLVPKAGAIAALIKILEMERPEVEVEDETEEEDEYGTTTDESDMEVIEDPHID